MLNGAAQGAPARAQMGRAARVMGSNAVVIDVPDLVVAYLLKQSVRPALPSPLSLSLSPRARPVSDPLSQLPSGFSLSPTPSPLPPLHFAATPLSPRTGHVFAGTGGASSPAARGLYGGRASAGAGTGARQSFADGSQRVPFRSPSQPAGDGAPRTRGSALAAMMEAIDASRAQRK